MVQEVFIDKNSSIDMEKDPKKDFHVEACELCGYKIKYRDYMNRPSEKNYHLLSAHFKSKLEQELGQEISKSLPNCPIENCLSSNFSKSSELIRHIGGATHVEKHGHLLKKWFQEEIESKNESKRVVQNDENSENVEETSDINISAGSNNKKSEMKSYWGKCELCEYEYPPIKSKPERQKNSHLALHHFKSKLELTLENMLAEKQNQEEESIGCPFENCSAFSPMTLSSRKFRRSELLIHIGEKHGLNTKWLNEELQSKSNSANR